MRLKLPRPIQRSLLKFAEDPASMGNAVRLIIVVTLGAVFIGSGVIWLFDHRDFPDYGTALWFSLQTVTTVGYGDVTPVTVIGRTVAGIVMVVAVGFIAVITAAITSTFVEAAQGRRRTADKADRDDASQRLEARLDDISRRLDRIERRLDIPASAPDAANARDAANAADRPPAPNARDAPIAADRPHAPNDRPAG